VTDTLVEDVLCGSGPLEPGGSLACAGSYAITQDDLDAGSLTNIALGEGTYGGSEVVASDEASLTITAVAT
jgi:cystathionine beta-lyase family protein involved in aluminum resistance